MDFFLSWSQIITFLSSPPEQIRFISLLNLAELTQLVCPTKELLNFKVSISHNLIVLSIHPLNIILPSVEKSNDKTGAVCPLIVFVFICEPGYHKLIVLSWEALANIFSFGEKTTSLHFLSCPCRSSLRLGFNVFHK